MAAKKRAMGKVIIAGAGPGDPELITVKTLSYLQRADVVMVDRLVSPQLLTHVKKEAVIIFVGKQTRNEYSTPQAETNLLLVEHARHYDLVLRLKGGDVSIFGNLTDELQCLIAYNIPYEIVPGIGASSGAAAFCGIPLTARGIAAGVRFLTIYSSEMTDGLNWADLASTNDTLVFYMSSAHLGEIVRNLLDQGISDDKLLAIVQQATTPQQDIRIFNLYEYEFNAGEQKLASPTLIIIGKVVGLHERFKWRSNGRSGDYFQSLGHVHQSADRLVTP